MTRPPVQLRTTVAGELADAFAALREELGLVEEFPELAEAEAQLAVADAGLPAADLTAIPFITIDPEGATDLDQAMHLQRLYNPDDSAGYLVRYAIADLPAYVRADGAIDAESRRRGQTMYAPDRRVPLHPRVISEGAASLLPGGLRGAYVWEFRLDVDARVVSVSLTRARVRSVRQATYEEVQAEIEAGTASELLMLLKEFGLKRIELERERGGASLNRPSQEVRQRDGHYLLERRSGLPVEDWNAQLSLMTGMAAAQLMVGGGLGILRTMPAPDAETIAAYRRQTEALGCPWPESMQYGEYLKTLDPKEPNQLSAIYAASKLFRGAGYTVVADDAAEVPIQSALGAPYTHVTAPLRRLVDRFALVVCEALANNAPVPDWVTDALPTLPAIMAASGSVASRLENGSVAAVEAAVLSQHVGREFDATVISAGEDGGVIQLENPAVSARCTGRFQPGERIRAQLVEADIPSGTVSFARVAP
ncbi:RNB domain-containing ribonuclease [Homoserinimonas sp. A447]